MADEVPERPLAPHDDLRFLPPARTWAIVRAVLTPTWQQLMRLRVYGADRIPREGGAVLAINHQSNVDSFALGLAIRPRIIRYFAKTELFELPIVGWAMPRFGAVAVRRGESDRDAIRAARQVIAAGEILGIFVEGTRQKAIADVQPGAAMLAIASGAPIIVCCIHGSRRHGGNPLHPVSISFSTPLDVGSFGRGSKAYRAASLVLKENLLRQYAFLESVEAAGRPRRATPPEGIIELPAADA